MIVYREYIYPDCIKFHSEENGLLATANRIWVDKALVASFKEAGYTVLDYK